MYNTISHDLKQGAKYTLIFLFFQSFIGYMYMLCIVQGFDIKARPSDINVV